MSSKILFLFYLWFFFLPLDDSDVTQMVCISRLLFQTFCSIWNVTYNSECIYNETQNNEKCFTVLYPWLTPTCVIKTFVLSCLFLSGIMVLWCFGHVYKLDCEQLKLVYQSMEMWLQVTLLFHTVKVRLGNLRASRRDAPTPKTSVRITHFKLLDFWLLGFYHGVKQ